MVVAGGAGQKEIHAGSKHITIALVDHTPGSFSCWEVIPPYTLLPCALARSLARLPLIVLCSVLYMSLATWVPSRCANAVTKYLVPIQHPHPLRQMDQSDAEGASATRAIGNKLIIGDGLHFHSHFLSRRLQPKPLHYSAQLDADHCQSWWA